jgi:hypothetical protein
MNRANQGGKRENDCCRLDGCVTSGRGIMVLHPAAAYPMGSRATMHETTNESVMYRQECDGRTKVGCPRAIAHTEVVL